MLNLDTYLNQICSVTRIYIPGLVQPIVSFPPSVTCASALCPLRYVRVEKVLWFGIHTSAYRHEQISADLGGSILCYFHFWFLGKYSPDGKIQSGFVWSV